MIGTRISGRGHHAPARLVPNEDIERRLGLQAGWIESRVGIRARYYAAPDEALTDIARPAAQRALQDAGSPDIGFLILATSTPDHLLPPSAPLLAHQLGLKCGAADLAGACAGFIDALVMADGMVRAHGRGVLVVAANILSRRINPADPSTSALFADAAGAVVLSPAPGADSGVIAADLVSDGSGYDLIRIPAGGSRKPFSGELAPDELYMQMPDGRAVFSKAVDTMVASSEKVLRAAGASVSDIAHWIPHQANLRITAAVERRLGLDPSRTMSTLRDFGNSSAATIPLTLSHAGLSRNIATGDLCLMTAVGA
ncbi:MAG: beta-ketoacyl-ACP synthase 3, partial [Bradyrhizobium sp.]|nr:beta-ketoacyl-ACP synthase 3 [Bradyrhizobium sp.]